MLFSTIQAQNVSKEKISIGVDILNCLSVKYSVQDDGSKFECDCSKEIHFEDILECIPPGFTGTINLSNEINKIKGRIDWGYGEKELIKYLSSDAFDSKSKYPLLYKFSENRKDKEEFINWKEGLQANLEKKLLTVDSYSVENQSDAPADRQTLENKEEGLLLVEGEPSSNDKVNDNSSFFSFFTFEFDVVAILLIAFLLVLFYRLKAVPVQPYIADIEKIKNKISKEILKDINQSRTNSKGNTVSVSQEEIRKLHTEIEKLSKEIDLLKSNNISAGSIVEIQINKENTNEITSERDSNSADIFMPSPNSEGGFNNSSASVNYKDGASMYVLKKLSSTKASYRLDDRGSSINRALQLPDRNIIPVCESSNEYEPRFNKIKTDEPGVVELEGDKWIVKQKAKITYGN